MIKIQSQDGDVGRGLGFALWSPDPTNASFPLSENCFGHLGFTGTSLWMDPQRDLVIACLTNRVYYGRNNATEIAQFRFEMHKIISNILDNI